MAKVTGLGGVFYVAEDPAATRQWYEDVLGLTGDYGPQIAWSEEPHAAPYSLISHFKDDEYIRPGKGGFMINLRVDDCDAMVAQLKAKGIEIVEVDTVRLFMKAHGTSRSAAALYPISLGSRRRPWPRSPGSVRGASEILFRRLIR